MLIRFIVDNIFSFGKLTEFNTVPNNLLETLNDHKYELNGCNILKLSSIYGANGAGKSNFVKSLQLLMALVLGETVPFKTAELRFKLDSNKNERPQALAVEFIEDDTAFYYGIELKDNVVSMEELYISGLGKKNDELIYKRETDKNRITKIEFSKEFELEKDNQVLKKIILDEFVKSDELVLELISKRNNSHLMETKKAFNWFKETLHIVTPESKAWPYITNEIASDEEFKKYAENMICLSDIGITSLTAARHEPSDVFGEKSDEFLKAVGNSSSEIQYLSNESGQEVILRKEEGKVWVRKLEFGHLNDKGRPVQFEIYEESDGTRRLLDLTIAFYEMISKNRVFIIDEIERSIHPLLIKELIRKFSLDCNTKGQLIFTTHESNLLDQDIFRKDEIWFAQKDENGSTNLYSLADYKAHSLVDIQKSYLNGRYGSIPFLGNLEDLNWNENDRK